MYTKFKKGATSLIVTLFFTLLAGILVLSFVSIMLSNINESTNYNLSQSAYDAALAGIEDAKIMLLEYNNCIARNDLTSDRCKTIVETINTAGSEDDCDIIRKALKRASGDSERETVVRSNNGSTGGVDESFDMAYTCVKISTKTPNYLGTITKDTDTKVIPLRTRSASVQNEESQVTKVRIEWFSNEDFATLRDNNLMSDYMVAPTLSSSMTPFTSNKIKPSQITDNTNTFSDTASLPPVLNVGLIQAAANFKLSSFNQINGSNTNRGRITLRPIYDSSAFTGPADAPELASQTISSSVFANSLKATVNNDWNNTNKHDDKSDMYNSPIDIKCHNADTIGTHTYACSATIGLPKTSDGKNALDTFRYLTLSAPYPDPDISFSVTLLNSNDHVVNFVGVQSSVDSTGRASDLFRRIDARIELIDIGYPFPKYTLGVYCDTVNGNSECNGTGSIIKNYRATNNCWVIENGENKSADCKDYASDGDGKGSFNPDAAI